VPRQWGPLCHGQAAHVHIPARQAHAYDQHVRGIWKNVTDSRFCRRRRPESVHIHVWIGLVPKTECVHRVAAQPEVVMGLAIHGLHVALPFSPSVQPDIGEIGLETVGLTDDPLWKLLARPVGPLSRDQDRVSVRHTVFDSRIQCRHVVSHCRRDRNCHIAVNASTRNSQRTASRALERGSFGAAMTRSS